MSDNDLRKQFPFRPSGKDFDRLVEVVQEMERRKYSGQPAEVVVADICNVYVLAHTATQRLQEIKASDPDRVAMADLWGEGFQYGVLFQRAGGTVHEHKPVVSKTTLVRAMVPGRRIVRRERPYIADHPDWAMMDRVLDRINQLFDRDVATESAYNDIVDVYAMVYIAANRVGLNFHGIDTDQAIRYTDAWVEGFLYGVLFEQER